MKFAEWIFVETVQLSFICKQVQWTILAKSKAIHNLDIVKNMKSKKSLKKSSLAAKNIKASSRNVDKNRSWNIAKCSGGHWQYKRLPWIRICLISKYWKHKNVQSGQKKKWGREEKRWYDRWAPVILEWIHTKYPNGFRQLWISDSVAMRAVCECVRVWMHRVHQCISRVGFRIFVDARLISKRDKL